MAKRRFALYDRERECDCPSLRYTGSIPCTGVLRCDLCGALYDPVTREILGERP